MDNSSVDCQGLSSRKVQPLLDVLGDTFLKQYSPGHVATRAVCGRVNGEVQRSL